MSQDKRQAVNLGQMSVSEIVILANQIPTPHLDLLPNGDVIKYVDEAKKQDELPCRSVELIKLQIEATSVCVRPGYVLIELDPNQVNRLIGKLKTIIDAAIPSGTDSTVSHDRQAMAIKDLISQEVWSWVGKQNNSDQRIRDLNEAHSVPEESREAI